MVFDVKVRINRHPGIQQTHIGPDFLQAILRRSVMRRVNGSMRLSLAINICCATRGPVALLFVLIANLQIRLELISLSLQSSKQLD
jgi:hypothetical protein